jgi:hypothetical protein
VPVNTLRRVKKSNLENSEDMRRLAALIGAD